MDARKVYAVCRRGLVGRGIRWGEVVGVNSVQSEKQSGFPSWMGHQRCAG